MDWIHLTLKVERWRQALRRCYKKRLEIEEKAFEIQIPLLYGRYYSTFLIYTLNQSMSKGKRVNKSQKISKASTS